MANESVRHHGFGAKDKRGRKVGVRIKTFEVKFKASPDAKMWYPIEPGYYYALNVWGTRDGKPFGPIQSTRYFPTIAKRDAALRTYLTGATKRAGGK